MNEQEHNDFLTGIAEEVGEQIINKANMSCFRKHDIVFWEQYKVYCQAVEQDRQAAESNSRLRDKDAGPPKKGYVWYDQELSKAIPEGYWRRAEENMPLNPRELLYFPENSMIEFMFPPQPRRHQIEKNLPAYYAFLTVIHDSDKYRVDDIKINNGIWPDNEKWSSRILEEINWEHFTELDTANRLRTYIKLIFKHVKADLKEIESTTEFMPREVQLMELIAKELKIWFQDAPGDENYPSGTVALRLRNGVSLAVEFLYLDEVLTRLRVNNHKEIALYLEEERDRFLSDLQAVEQTIEIGEGPLLDLIELRSKITGLMGKLEDTAAAFKDKLKSENSTETENIEQQGKDGQNKNKNDVAIDQSETQMSKPLSSAKWAFIFGVSRSTMRKWRKEKKYPFVQVSERKWSLPIQKLPGEYLQQYQQHSKPTKT